MSSRLLIFLLSLSLSRTVGEEEEQISATCSADGFDCGETRPLLLQKEQKEEEQEEGEFEPCSTREEREAEGHLYRMLILKAGYILQE